MICVRKWQAMQKVYSMQLSFYLTPTQEQQREFTIVKQQKLTLLDEIYATNEKAHIAVSLILWCAQEDETGHWKVEVLLL